MTYNDLLQHFFERSNALQWYWTLYVVVVGVWLAFSVARMRRNFAATTLVTVLFSFFAWKNLGAIRDVTIQRIAIVEAIRKHNATETELVVKASRTLIEPTLETPEYAGIRNFHIISDVLVILGIWVLERRRKKED